MKRNQLELCIQEIQDILYLNKIYNQLSAIMEHQKVLPYLKIKTEEYNFNNFQNKGSAFVVFDSKENADKAT